jgi:hypothetical protein
MEVSLGRCCGWQTPPPSPTEGHFWWMLSEGRGLLPATSGDFSWPPAGTSSGHQRRLSHGHGQYLRNFSRIVTEETTAPDIVSLMVERHPDWGNLHTLWPPRRRLPSGGTPNSEDCVAIEHVATEWRRHARSGRASRAGANIRCSVRHHPATPSAAQRFTSGGFRSGGAGRVRIGSACMLSARSVMTRDIGDKCVATS